MYVHKDSKLAQLRESNTEEFLAESMQMLNKLLAENKIYGYVKPFIASGLTVFDKKGKFVAEVSSYEVAKQIAKALNSFITEAKIVYDKKTARMTLDSKDQDTRYGLYVAGVLRRAYWSKEQAENVKKRDPRFTNAVVKKIVTEGKVYQFPDKMPKKEKVSLDFARYDEYDEYDAAKKVGIRFAEKPDYFEYLDSDWKAVTALDIKKLEKMIGRKLKIYPENKLFGRPTKGTSESLANKPTEQTYIVRRNNGKYYLANAAFANTYIRMWAPIQDGTFSDIKLDLKY